VGEAHPNYARACTTWALLYTAMGDYGAGRAALQAGCGKSNKKKRQGEAHPDYASCLHKPGGALYKTMGDSARAGRSQAGPGSRKKARAKPTPAPPKV